MCNKGFIVVVLLFFATVSTFAQTPSPTPPDKRGLGIESPGQTTNTTTDQRAREAKPELVLQTGYNNFYGATRMVFSPDGRLLATATYRSNTIKLWETATNRKLRDGRADIDNFTCKILTNCHGKCRGHRLLHVALPDSNQLGSHLHHEYGRGVDDLRSTCAERLPVSMWQRHHTGVCELLSL